MNHTVDVFTAEALATLLGCAVTTIEERARSGDLPGLKFGDGGWRFPAEALARRLNELAIEEAAKRRQPTTRSGVLKQLPGGKAKRTPPALPPP